MGGSINKTILNPELIVKLIDYFSYLLLIKKFEVKIKNKFKIIESKDGFW